MLYFAYDSIVDLSEPEKIWHLMDAAVKYYCELRNTYFDQIPLETNEGYSLIRYFAASPTEENWELFRNEVSKQIVGISWFAISEAHYLRISQLNGIRLPTLHEEFEEAPTVFLSEIDGIVDGAHYNAELRKLLANDAFSHYRCDWILPRQREAQHAQLEELRHAASGLSFGWQIRLAGIVQVESEEIIQTLVIRLRSQSDAELLRNKLYMVSGWAEAPAAIFLKGTPFIGNQTVDITLDLILSNIRKPTVDEA